MNAVRLRHHPTPLARTPKIGGVLPRSPHRHCHQRGTRLLQIPLCLDLDRQGDRRPLDRLRSLHPLVVAVLDNILRTGCVVRGALLEFLRARLLVRRTLQGGRRGGASAASRGRRTLQGGRRGGARAVRRGGVAVVVRVVHLASIGRVLFLQLGRRTVRRGSRARLLVRRTLQSGLRGGGGARAARRGGVDVVVHVVHLASIGRVLFLQLGRRTVRRGSSSVRHKERIRNHGRNSSPSCVGQRRTNVEEGSP